MVRLSAVLFPDEKVPRFRRFRKFINQNVGIGNSESGEGVPRLVDPRVKPEDDERRED
ncbi:protein of unknown function [Shinella sp. WSC3-e]|nr:protein of unknown function [Shinella sp. WSC3-e]